MKILKEIRFYFVIVSLGFISLLVFHFRLKNELMKCQTDMYHVDGGDILKAQMIDSLQNLSDSLFSENYPCQIELNRFQTAYEIFLRRNPKAAKEYGDIIANETE